MTARYSLAASRAAWGEASLPPSAPEFLGVVRNALCEAVQCLPICERAARRPSQQSPQKNRCSCTSHALGRPAGVGSKSAEAKDLCTRFKIGEPKSAHPGSTPKSSNRAGTRSSRGTTRGNDMLGILTWSPTCEPDRGNGFIRIKKGLRVVRFKRRFRTYPCSKPLCTLNPR